MSSLFTGHTIISEFSTSSTVIFSASCAEG
jgi:hypothetical protein